MSETVIFLRIKEAVVERLQQICIERDISYYRLAQMSGVDPSTIYTIFRENRKGLTMSTVKTLCDGLEISLIEFFNHYLFKNLSPENE